MRVSSMDPVQRKIHLVLVDGIRLPFFVETLMEPFGLDQLPHVDVS